jgi:hypothetical protein
MTTLTIPEDPTMRDIKDLHNLSSRLRYKKDEKFREMKDTFNKQWYAKKNLETDNAYKKELCARMKKKYEENEEFREKAKKKRMERYYRQKAEKEEQMAAEQLKKDIEYQKLDEIRILLQKAGLCV